MGKGTDKLYITHSEWSSSDAYSASVGANARSSSSTNSAASFKRLPFNFCAASLQPFKNPVCTPDGTIFDVEIISAWLAKHPTNPVNGQPLAAKDLIKLNFARNADTSVTADRNGVPTDGKGDFIDPVSFKVFTDNTHIVAVRHGTYANVFAWDTVERMNIKAKVWRDLVDDAEFGRRDIITLQDPQNAASRDLSQFKYLQDGSDALLTPEQQAERQSSNVNIAALGRMGEKVLRAKEAVSRARQQRTDPNRTTTALSKPSSTAPTPTPRSLIQEKTLAHNAAGYTTGAAAASFTSTGLTPSTSADRALLTQEEWLLKPKVVKTLGYARLSTSHGDLLIELHPEFAPKAVWNFTRLAQRGSYRSVPFHRSVRNFMIQGGDPTGTGRGGTSIWGKNFEDELQGPLTHDARGVVSMANKGKNTNSSQFFITYKAAPHLDRKHTVFGKVVEGADTTLARMEAVKVDEGSRPVEEILIKEVVVYVDPFEEFLKDKGKREKEEAERKEVQRTGGTEDDRTTWTGKRIRTAGDEGVEEWEEAEQPRKKAKMGGFGNFDAW
ncbi:hypothetical protein B0T18DRAFT_483894 [Schizothecium vesticola]|uniref:Peptidyl-prolyl cis-trans isomerase-like 2 n=1 Tax=Schizothecium vesticola TaxID=314040 RepID=A0AA40F896_9PEZI|nr:hypothetical protein B0T18DRAFT_483894 [Schizothecium vesticola]